MLREVSTSSGVSRDVDGPHPPGLYTSPPVADGIICIAAPQYRYNSVSLGHLFMFDANGVSQSTAGGGPSTLQTDGSFGPVPETLAGQSWAFQAWYRDHPAGGGPVSDFSESRIVTFL